MSRVKLNVKVDSMEVTLRWNEATALLGLLSSPAIAEGRTGGKLLRLRERLVHEVFAALDLLLGESWRR